MKAKILVLMVVKYVKDSFTVVRECMGSADYLDHDMTNNGVKNLIRLLIYAVRVDRLDMDSETES